MPGPFPPASNASNPPFEYSGAYCARAGTHNVGNVNGGTTLTVNSNADNAQHWTQVYCGHEIQINESLTGGGPNPSTDPIKTGSVYGFRNLNAKQSGTYERLTKGVWHQYEIRTIGQQYTIMIDGKIINQFDNSIPKVNTRNGDPPTMARQFTQGYLGLQTHGGTDRISYREIQVKDVAPADIPVNTVAPIGLGLRLPGQPADLQPRHVERGPGHAVLRQVVPLEQDRCRRNPRFRAPSSTDLGNFTTPADPTYGTQALTWTDSLLLGDGDTYTPVAEDVGKVIHCAVNADNAGATVWKTAVAPEILTAINAEGGAGASVPATLSLTLGAAGVVRRRSRPRWRRTTTPPPRRTSSRRPARRRSRSPTRAHRHRPPRQRHVLAAVRGCRRGRRARRASAVPYNDVGGSANPTSLLTYAGPTSNDAVALQFRQHIGQTDALRTGSYSKTLTFTLSTTTP